MKTSPSHSLHGRLLTRNRGSVLLVALLLSAVIAISLGSYIKLGNNAINLATRTFYGNTALNMAEAGVEEAVWCFNIVSAAEEAGTSLSAAFAASWDAQGWARTGTLTGTAKHTFSYFSFPGNITGNVKVYVDNYYPGGVIRPTVVALATINFPHGAPIVKQLEVQLRRRSREEAAMQAPKITYKGNVQLDSWDSARTPDGILRTPPVVYDPTPGTGNRQANCGIACTTVTVIDVGNADVYGSAATAGDSSAYINVGPTGRIGSFTTAAGVKDPEHITTDFISQIEPKTMPAGGTALASYPASATPLGTIGATNKYRISSGITSSLIINGDVTLYIDVAPGQFAINLSGTQSISIPPGSSLTIYSAGNVDATGATRINNANPQPKTFKFYGTSTSTIAQTINIGGNSAFNGVVDAPNADVKLHGNDHFYGSIIGKEITVLGNSKFHYDESLATEGGYNPFGVNKWRELNTPAARAEYAAVMSGW